VERIWLGLAEQFAERGHEVTLVLRQDQNRPAEEMRGKLRLLRGTAYKRSNRTRGDLIRDLFYSWWAARRVPRADILVTNTFFLPIVQRLLVLKPQNLHVGVHRFPKKQMGLYLNAKRLAAVSVPVARAIVEQTPRAGKLVKVLSNPIDVHTMVPPAVPRDFSGAKTLLYTGRITEEKGIHLLIAAYRVALAKHPELRLRLLGPWKTAQGGGGEAYVASLKNLAGNTAVEFAEPVFDSKLLARELQAAHYYAYPSLADKGESFGVAPLEAMATGLVPILSSLEVFRDYATDGENAIFFDHRSDKAALNLADAITRTIENPEQYARMSAAAVRRAQDFSYENVAAAYLADFEEILKASRRGHFRTR
jgi:glycosyltransferase involved in cell wall biosynthesis